MIMLINTNNMKTLDNVAYVLKYSANKDMFGGILQSQYANIIIPMTHPQGPHSHIVMMGGLKDFFGSDILAKRDFFCL